MSLQNMRAKRVTSTYINITFVHVTMVTDLYFYQDLTPRDTEVPSVMVDDDSIGAGSYVGGLVCIVFLVIIIITYLATRSVSKKHFLACKLYSSDIQYCHHPPHVLCFSSFHSHFFIFPRELRTSPLGVSLINTSLCLSALFISYIISYYTTDSDWSCTIFSAIFHYIFLVTSFSLFILALLKTMQPEKLTFFFGLLIAQFGKELHTVHCQAY